MKRRYKEAFEQLNTRDNLEEHIISTCMNAEPENTPELRRMPKRIVPVAAAAALGVGVLGVSAYAITTNIHRQADTYFTQNDVNTELVSETEAECESRIYDEYYRELNLSAVSGDTTVNLHGFISDNCHVYLFGNIVAPADMVLDAEHPDTDQEYDFGGGIPEMDWGESHGVWNGYLSFLPFDEAVPNQREFVYKMTYSGEFKWDMVKSLTFTDFAEVNDKHSCDTMITGTWEFPVLDLTTTHEPISLIDEPVQLTWNWDDGTAAALAVDDITISLFGIQFEETDKIHGSANPSIVNIVMKDGTVYEDMDDNMDNILVDLDEVDYVQIGDQSFDMPE